MHDYDKRIARKVDQVDRAVAYKSGLLLQLLQMRNLGKLEAASCPEDEDLDLSTSRQQRAIVVVDSGDATSADCSCHTAGVPEELVVS